MRKHLTTVLKYFAFFAYAPSFSEIYTFFPKKIVKKDLKELLMREVKGKIIVKLQQLQDTQLFSLSHGSNNHYSLATNHSRYTLPQYSTPEGSKLKLNHKIKIKKSLRIIQIYINILKLLPFVRFVGITGSTAMNGHPPPYGDDDVDLFIITKKHTLWTTRFFVVVMAKLLGIHGGIGVCLNLFFDESSVVIPIVKQNSYIAHELLQMKPVIDKNSTYSLLIQANEWIFNYFPNAPSVIPAPALPRGRKVGMTQKIDLFFKSIQFPIIKKNKTGFRITDHQLWLFKRDFEKKLKKNGLGR